MSKKIEIEVEEYVYFQLVIKKAFKLFAEASQLSREGLTAFHQDLIHLAKELNDAIRDYENFKETIQND